MAIDHRAYLKPDVVAHDMWCTRYLDYLNLDEADDACDCVRKDIIALAERIEELESQLGVDAGIQKA